MNNVVRLPTAATSYYTVRKSGAWWCVELVTPAPGKALRTMLAALSDRDAAMTEGRNAAARTKRPFREPRKPS